MATAIKVAHDLSEFLYRDVDYAFFLHPASHIEFTDDGRQKLLDMASRFDSYWQRENRMEELFKLAILARDKFIKDHHYIVQEGEVVIVDDSTGRAMPGRNWSHGIHQAVEAKEGIELKSPGKTVARMTFQEFFRHYALVCGASGTLHGLDLEMWRTYGLSVIRIPPNKKSQLRVLPRRIFRTKADKFLGLVQRVEELHHRHVPVLVGTRRIQDSEDIAEALRDRGMQCQVLNAKQHQYEAEIVAKAGALDAITVATNMAGRGTDIAIDNEAEKIGGLHVLMFDPHESARVDWQLFGRAGRQGAQGAAQAFTSAEDELLTKFLPHVFKPLLWPNLPTWVLHSGMPLMLWLAQKMAQRDAAKQRQQLADVQTELRKLLSFISGR